MNNHSYKKNTSNFKNNESLFHFGNSLIFDSKFDIKRYFNKINYNQKDDKKYNLPLLFDNLYIRTKIDNKKYELSTITNENLLSYRKNKIRKKNPSIGMFTNKSCDNNKIIINDDNNSNIIYDNNSIINNKLQLNKNNRKTYFERDKNTKSLEPYRKYLLSNNKEEQYNSAKVIKNIKKFAEFSKRDDSIKDLLEHKIVYDPKNIDAIYKPISIINEYQKFQSNKLNKSKNNISVFLTESNEISKKNLLIKLLKKRKNDYNDYITEHQETIENNIKLLDLYENNFLDYKINKILAKKRIDDLHTKLFIENRKLLRERYKLKSELRIKEDERQKLLERLDELRIIAKFITKVLDDNLDIFHKNIIPEYSSEKLPNYELITQEVLERFCFLLNDKKTLKEEEINIIKQINQLNDSELLYNQFHKKEEDIINTLKNREAINKEIEDIKKEGIKHNMDIKKRIENLENELNLNKSLYEKEIKEYEEIYKRNYSGDEEFVELIKELYLEVMNIENNKKNKKNIININRAVIDLKKDIIGKEEKINKLQTLLEKYEKNDKYLFDKLVYKRKKEIKEIKVNITKQKIEEGEKEKIKQLRPMKNIVFIQRKWEPPIYKPKKEQKIIIDPELIRNLENEDLIVYE